MHRDQTVNLVVSFLLAKLKLWGFKKQHEIPTEEFFASLSPLVSLWLPVYLCYPCVLFMSL